MSNQRSILKDVNLVQVAIAVLILVAGIMIIRYIAKGGFFSDVGGVIEKGGEYVYDGATWVWEGLERAPGIIEEGAEDVWDWMKQLDVGW